MIHVVRLGTPRLPNEGLRLGTVRRPPRGVKKTDYARLNYYDVWLPELSPSPLLFSWMMGANVTAARWKSFARRYQAEMKKPEPQRLLALLAALSQQTNLSVGCYCENESRCHRSLLYELLQQQGAFMAPRA